MQHRNTTPTFKTTPSYQVRSPDQAPLVDHGEQRRRSVPTTTQGNTPPALRAIKPALGPQPQNAKFYRPDVVTLVMKTKVFSLTGDDLAVRTVDGEDIMQCKTKMASIHRKKKLLDVEGNDMVCPIRRFSQSQRFQWEWEMLICASADS